LAGGFSASALFYTQTLNFTFMKMLFLNPMLKAFGILLMVCLSSSFLMAQGGTPGPEAPGVTPDEAPIDGITTALLAGGVALGLRKWKQSKNEE
jgi:hypothetical protein